MDIIYWNNKKIKTHTPLENIVMEDGKVFDQAVCIDCYHDLSDDKRFVDKYGLFVCEDCFNQL